jgi:predicted  nucleic acid-binding Zn-ribbon protein
MYEFLSRLEGLTEELRTLQAEFESMKKKVEDISYDIGNLMERIETLEDLREKLNNL